MQSSGHRMEIIIILLISVEVVIVSMLISITAVQPTDYICDRFLSVKVPTCFTSCWRLSE